MGIIANLLKSTHAVEITAKEYPALIQAVEELAAKSGMKKVPKLHLISHPISGRIPNAVALGSENLVLAPKLLEMFGGGGAAPVSEELKAVIGHEMSHMKNIHRDWGGTRLPVLLAPVAATLGYHYYKKASKNSTNNEGFHRNLNDIVSKERADIAAASEEKFGVEKEMHMMGDKLVTVAKYAAVAIAGLGAGLLMARQFSRTFEYSADKFGAKLVSPEAMGNALKKIHGDFEAWLIKNEHRSSAIGKLVSNTIMAHPSLEERLANLAR